MKNNILQLPLRRMKYRDIYELQNTTLGGIAVGPTHVFYNWKDVRQHLITACHISKAHAEFVIAVTQHSPNVPYDLVESDDTPQGEVIIWTGQLTLKRYVRN